MKNSAAILFASHAVVFLGGVVIGRKMDADELSQYRKSNESTFTRWSRKATNAALGIGVVSTIIVIVRMSQRIAISGSGTNVNTSTAKS